jgi:hypothetical protein
VLIKFDFPLSKLLSIQISPAFYFPGLIFF